MEKIIKYGLSTWLSFFALTGYAGNPQIFVATDKENYAPRESVQFQIFLLQNTISNSTVFIELLDCKGNKLNRQMLPLRSNVAWGSFELPEKQNAGYYFLNCYMVSNGLVKFKYVKKISVGIDITRSLKSPGKKILISCFAEGGTFVAESPNNILIRYADEDGNAVTASGKITDEKEKVLTGFNTDERGVAKINFNPEYGHQYKIVAVNSSGTRFIQDLPPVSQYGVTLNVTNTDTGFIYRVISYNYDEQQLDYKLEVISNQQAVYEATINFSVRLSLIKEVLRSADFPEGFLSFRLIDKNNKLRAERIFYNSSPSSINKRITIVDTINKRAAITQLPGYISGIGYLNILSKKMNEPVNAGGPLSAIKENAGKPVLETYGAGEISINDHLIKLTALPPIAAIENANEKSFLTLSGRAYDSEEKPIKSRKLNLIIVQKNLKKDFLIATTDRQGNFEISGLLFYDSAKVYYQLADKSGDKNSIRIDLKVTPSDSVAGNKINAGDITCIDIIPVLMDTTGNAAIQSLPGEKTLKEVVLEAVRPKTKTEIFEEAYISKQYNNKAFLRNEVNFIENPPVIDNTPLFSYLRGRMALTIRIDGAGKASVTTISGDIVGVYLDDMYLESSDLEILANTTINQIALARYYSMSFKPKSIKGFDGGDLMIYTKRDYTLTDPKVRGLNKTVVLGYTAEKPVRQIPNIGEATATLYWRPNWAPQKEEIIFIGLPVDNTGKNVQLIIQGINAEYTPYSFTKNLVFN